MITQLSTSKIVRGTNTRASNEADSTLIQSVKRLGIIEPLVVAAEQDGTHLLLAGHRRLSAAEALELPTVPVVVRDSENSDPMVTLAENMVRLDLLPLEIANYVAAALKLEGVTGREIAQAIGRSEAWISKCKKIAKTYDKATEKERAYMAEFTNGEELYEYCSPKKKAKPVPAPAAPSMPTEEGGEGSGQIDLVEKQQQQKRDELRQRVAELAGITFDAVSVEFIGDEIAVGLRFASMRSLLTAFDAAE